MTSFLPRRRRDWRAIAEARLARIDELLRQRRADSDSMVEAFVECPECGASIRARMAQGDA